MKNIKLFEIFGFRKIMTIKKFNEELSFSLIKCDYKVRTVDNPYYMTSAKSKVYQFTVHDKVYDVYFTLTKEYNHELSDGTSIYDYAKHITKNNGANIPTIYFTLSGRKYDEFNDLTGLNTPLDVIGRVMYIISEIIKNNNYNIYVIEAIDKKMKIYSNYFSKMGLQVKKGWSYTYRKDVYYLIVGK